MDISKYIRTKLSLLIVVAILCVFVSPWAVLGILLVAYYLWLSLTGEL